MDQKNTKFISRKFLGNLALICLGVLFYVLLLNFGTVKSELGAIVKIFVPFIAGGTLAYLLNIPMSYIEKRLPDFKCKRGVCIAIVYFIAIMVLYALGYLVLPQLWSSVSQLVSNIQLYMDNLSKFVHEMSIKYELNYDTVTAVEEFYEEYITSITAYLKALMPQILNISISLGKGVVTAFTAIISSIYLLLDKEKILHQSEKLIYAFAPSKRTKRIIDMFSRSNRIFGNFVGGKIIDSAIIFVLCLIGMSFINPQLAMLISVIVGVTNIIPFFGPFIGAIPSVLLLIIVDPVSALWFAGFILFLQQLDGNIIGPKILGDSTGLSALLVLVAIVVFGELFGFVGMVIGVPLFSVINIIVTDIVDYQLRHKGVVVKDGKVIPPDLINKQKSEKNYIHIEEKNDIVVLETDKNNSENS